MSEIKVPLTQATLGVEEAEAAAAVIRSGWVTMGERVGAFEAAFAQALGARHAIAVSNGTAALELAYAAVGLGPGDEFLLPSLTFVATLNAGLTLGARPVLVDVHSETDLTISPEDLARKLTPRSRLIVTMPYGGFCPDITSILAIAGERDLAVIEDAAHAPLARLDGRCMGTFGDAGAFSFFGNKNMTTGEGGMIVTNNDSLAARLRLLRSHGMTTLTWERHRGHAACYDVLEPGHNARLDEIRAAVGLEQLQKLPAANKARAHASRELRGRLRELGIEGLVIPFAQPRGEPVHHLFPVLLPPGTGRDGFRQALLARGVQTSVHYPPLQTFSMGRELWPEPPDLPVLSRIAERLVSLPMGPALEEWQIELMVESIEDTLKG